MNNRNSRILRPAGPTSGVMRVFVLVGGQFDPGVPELWVVVYMIIGGKFYFSFLCGYLYSLD